MQPAEDDHQAIAEPGPASVPKEAAELREILVFLDGQAENSAAVEFAGELAAEHCAYLIGVFLQAEPTITPEQTFARGAGMRNVAEVYRAQLDGTEAGQRALFEDVVRRHGIHSEWRLAPHSSEAVAHTRYADLAVLARPEIAGQTASAPGFLDSLVLTSGRPIMMLPPRCTALRVRRIIVGWNAGREASRAVADGLPFIVRAEAVEVLIVDDELHPERYGPEPGADIARHLARHGARVEVKRVPAGGENVGRILLSEAAAFDAHLVVMGAYGHSRLRGWVFGSVTRTVLQEAGLPVLMSR